MARPTSSKKILALTKYSRAIYKQPVNTNNTQSFKGDCDWHHHTQPALRLLLEIEKSAQGVPESMRLRVVWTTDKCHTPMTSKTQQQQQQENVIFEDIDLLVVRKHIHPFPIQGLPLKAVFRDNMVGIRYLPPDAKSSNSSEYCRFQITFQFPNDTAALIEAIRDVCPCKPSPDNSPATSIDPVKSGLVRPGGPDIMYHSSQSQAHFPAQSQSQIPQTPSGNRFSSNLTQRPDARLSLPPSSQLNLFSDSTTDFAVPFHQSRQNTSVPNLNPGTQAHQSQALARHHSLAQQATQIVPSFSTPSPLYPPTLQQSNMQLPTRRSTMTIYDSTIPPLQITRSDPNVSNTVAMPTPPASSQGLDFSSATRSSRMPPSELSDADAISSATTKHVLLESLYEACRLDHLPREELEQLVAHIVREDGFTDLLEKMDSLWQLKTVVNM